MKLSDLKVDSCSKGQLSPYLGDIDGRNLPFMKFINSDFGVTTFSGNIFFDSSFCELLRNIHKFKHEPILQFTTLCSADYSLATTDVAEKGIKDAIYTKKNNIRTLNSTKEYILWFSPEVVLLRDKFRVFCEEQKIKFKITRDPKKANLIVQNTSEKHKLFNKHSRSNKYVFITINDVIIPLTSKSAETIMNYDANNFIKSDANIYSDISDVLFSHCEDLLAKKTNPIDKSDISRYRGHTSWNLFNIFEPIVYPVIQNNSKEEIIEFIEKVKKALENSFSLVIFNDKGFLETFKTDKFLRIVEEVSSTANKDIIEESSLTKQIIDANEMIVFGETYKNLSALFENPNNFEMIIKSFSNINLEKSKIFTFLLYIKLYNYNLNKAVSGYKNRIEFKTLKTNIEQLYIKYEILANASDSKKTISELLKIANECYSELNRKHNFIYDPYDYDISRFQRNVSCIRTAIVFENPGNKNYTAYNSLIHELFTFMYHIYLIYGIEKYLETIKKVFIEYQNLIYNNRELIYVNIYNCDLLNRPELLNMILKCLEIEEPVMSGNELV